MSGANSLINLNTRQSSDFSGFMRGYNSIIYINEPMTISLYSFALYNATVIVDSSLTGYPMRCTLKFLQMLRSSFYTRSAVVLRIILLVLVNYYDILYFVDHSQQCYFMIYH